MLVVENELKAFLVVLVGGNIKEVMLLRNCMMLSFENRHIENVQGVTK